MRFEDREFAETHWAGAVSATCAPAPWGGLRTGNRLVDSRTVRVDVPPARAFRPVQRIGGTTGWYYGGWLWRAARRPRPSRRRGRAETRPPSSGRGARRRGPGFLARRGLRTRPAAAAPGRDEAARTRLARVHRRTGRRGRADHADRRLRPARPGRSGLLVRHLAAAPDGLRRHAPEPGPGRPPRGLRRLDLIRSGRYHACPTSGKIR
ncbi:MAG: hypothetical protein MZV63_13460 [Marinilabiliales bacterium]|nr:hypothetical protein [Marinilabiliales bacterium]